MFTFPHRFENYAHMSHSRYKSNWLRHVIRMKNNTMPKILK